jgi:hypothetical protein
LPNGHPFDLRDGGPHFWSASVYVPDATSAYAVAFLAEQPAAVPGARVYPKDFKLRVWCVRGGQGGRP